MNATIAHLEGFEAYYGLQLSDIGEDGEVIVLGHHGSDPHRVIGALNQHARRCWGFANLMDDRSAELAELQDMFVQTYAVARCGKTCRDAECVRCEEVRGGKREWWIEWNREPGEEHAFPATIWRGGA